jgi:hypothetical protein
MRAYKVLTAVSMGIGLIALGTVPVGATSVVATPAPAALHARRLVISWGKAEQVPGTATLNAGGHGQVEVLACPAAGDCTAGGLATPESPDNVSFVAGEQKGRWGKAARVPGLSKLDLGGQDYVTALSCPQVGYCVASGGYIDASAHVQAYVVAQSRGKWGTAREVPGLGKLNAGGDAGIGGISCPARGYCAAVGDYKDSASHFQALLIQESKGKWSGAEEATGTAALNSGGAALLNAVSCPSAGNCTAGGYYSDAFARIQPFVITETRGHWGKARVLAGVGALNAGGKAEILSVSCASPGNCSAGGFSSPAGFEQAPMIATETKGKWGKAEPVPGTAKLNTEHHGELLSVSCARNGSCGAAGYYETATASQSFVVSQVRGRWGTAENIPGLAKLNKRGFSEPGAIACPASGSCTTGGFYFDGSNHQQAYVATELSGKWDSAIEVPGSAALNKDDDSYIYDVACASPGNCSAGGFYKDTAMFIQPFVVNESARLRR